MTLFSDGRVFVHNILEPWRQMETQQMAEGKCHFVFYGDKSLTLTETLKRFSKAQAATT